MIEINLLPASLRYVEKDKKTVVLDWRKFILLVPALVALLVCSHVLLWVGGMVRVVKVKRLSAEWAALESEKKRIQEYDLEYAAVTKQASKVRDMVARRVLWGGKLKSLIRNLPSGVWFTDLSVSGGDFSLQGSVFAFETDEMVHIRQLIDGLNRDREFIADFKEFQLSSVQQRTLVLYEIADFTISGKLKRDGK